MGVARVDKDIAGRVAQVPKMLGFCPVMRFVDGGGRFTSDEEKDRLTAKRNGGRLRLTAKRNAGTPTADC